MLLELDLACAVSMRLALQHPDPHPALYIVDVLIELVISSTYVNGLL